MRQRSHTLRAVAIVAATMAGVPASGQGLEGLIERTLSSEQMQVEVIGLTGALSSEAQIETLRFSDPQGTWMTIEGATLNWNRAALLRRRVNINTLSADRIVLERLPAGSPAEPEEEPPSAASPGFQGFQIPELPVSLNIGELSVPSLVLGEPVLGERLEAQIDGSVTVEGGDALVSLSARRTDEDGSSLALSGGFTNATRQLAVDLNADIREGGTLSELSGIPGAPSLALRINGAGSVTDFLAQVQLRSDEVLRVAGDVWLLQDEITDETPEPPLEFRTRLDGDLRELLPPDLREFFGATTSLQIAGVAGAGGTFGLDTLELTSEALSVTGAVNIPGGGWPDVARLSIALAQDDDRPVRLPVPGPAVELQSVEADLNFDQAQGDAYTLEARLTGFTSEPAEVQSVQLRSAGQVVLPGETTPGSVTGDLDLMTAGLALQDIGLSEAIGSEQALSTGFRWEQDGALDLEGLALAAGPTRLSGDASFSNFAEGVDTETRATLTVSDLGPFATLADLPLTGQASATLDATLNLLGGTIDADLDATTTDLAVGLAAADAFAAGDGTLQVSVLRDETGLSVDRLNLELPQVQADGRATLRPGENLLDLTAHLRDPSGRPVNLPIPGQTVTLTDARVDLDFDEAQGDALRLQASVEGLQSDLVSTSSATVALDGTVALGPEGLPTAASGDLGVEVAGLVLEDAGLTEALGDAQSLSANVAWSADQSVTVEDLALSAGATRVAGSASVANLTATPKVDADLSIDLGALEQFATLADLALAGSATAKIAGSADLETTTFDVTADASANGLSTGLPTIDAMVAGDSTLSVVASVQGTEIDVPKLELQAPQLSMSGRATRLPGENAIDLTARVGGTAGEPLSLALPDQTITLTRATVEVAFDEQAGDAVTLRAALTDLESGIVSAAEASVTLDGQLKLTAEGLPAKTSGTLQARTAGISLADPALSETLGADQSVDVTFAWDETDTLTLEDLALLAGSTRLQGDVQVADLTSAQKIDADLALQVEALEQFASLAGLELRGRASAQVKGTADVATTSFDVEATADASGLATGNPTIDGIVGGNSTLVLDAQRAEGLLELSRLDLATPQLTVSGDGRLDDASADLSLEANLKNLATLVPKIPGPVKLTAELQGGDGPISVNASLEGPVGIAASTQGTVERDLSAASLKLDAASRLDLLAPFIQPRTMTGAVSAALALEGPLALDALSGRITVSEGRFADAALKLAVEQITVQTDLNQSAVQLSATAQSAQGGSVSLDGSVRLTDLVADLTTRLDAFRYSDPELVDTSVSGAINVSGPLTGGGQISGDLVIGRTEVIVSTAAGAQSGFVDGLEHVNEQTSSLEMRRRAGLVVDDKAPSGPPPPPFQLDVSVDASNPIFIRGLGLDAEVGGNLDITGTTAAIQPVGAFDLVRGRMIILGQRLDLTEGNVTLSGNSVPRVRFVATRRSSDFEVSAIIEGPLDEPEFRFESRPEAPEDEVLARLLFNTDLGNLSGVQALQLASSVAALRGGGSGLNLMGNLREGLGLDNIDITTDDEGQSNLSVGRYINDFTYTDVEIRGDGRTALTLNIDLTDALTVRGIAGSDGTSGGGIFFERDY